MYKYSYILSAYDLALAETVQEAQEPMAAEYTGAEKIIGHKLQGLMDRSTEKLRAQGFTEGQLLHEMFLNMRYEGSDTSLMILKPEDASEKSPLKQLKEVKIKGAPVPSQFTYVYFDSESGFVKTCVHRLRKLGSNVKLHGPAIIIDETQTIVVSPNAVFHVLDRFAVRCQHRRWLGKLKDGDVLVSNHPVSGGTHLPDVTVVTPVFEKGTDEIISTLPPAFTTANACLVGGTPPRFHLRVNIFPISLSDYVIMNEVYLKILSQDVKPVTFERVW
ncbi:hypothetical protein N0V84_000385 [Fusarium piperis]|uniref:Hydantoinase B/oxoprolinase domain-containing protein n=1 Tax=Fusarium piperis TaxID=1435070 RepID=A0A9W8WMT4_9HYPO|nr:hypothetical protein N0V84_000385 [Fusarium piperis]